MPSALSAFFPQTLSQQGSIILSAACESDKAGFLNDDHHINHIKQKTAGSS
jgi:hypothetical protein